MDQTELLEILIEQIRICARDALIACVRVKTMRNKPTRTHAGFLVFSRFFFGLVQQPREIRFYTNLRLKQRKIVPGFFVLARKASESVPIGTVRVADAARAEKTGAR